MKNLKLWLNKVHHKSVDFGNVTNGDRLYFVLTIFVALFLIII